MQMLLKGIQEVQMSNRQIEAAEMVLIRIAHAADLPSLNDALKTLNEADGAPSAIATHQTASTHPTGPSASAVVQSTGPSRMTSGGTVMALAAENESHRETIPNQQETITVFRSIVLKRLWHLWMRSGI